MEREFENIIISSLPDGEKLARAFFFILRQQQAYATSEIEMLQAVGDVQAVIKEQIKRDTLTYSGEILSYCYYRVSGKKLVDVQPS